MRKILTYSIDMVIQHIVNHLSCGFECFNLFAHQTSVMLVIDFAIIPNRDL